MQEITPKIMISYSKVHYSLHKLAHSGSFWQPIIYLFCQLYTCVPGSYAFTCLHHLTPPIFSFLLLQLCPEAFRARAPPLSARRSSLRTKETRTSCRTRRPWTPRKRTPTARSSNLLRGQDLGNPANLLGVRFHQNPQLGWDMHFPKTPQSSETSLVPVSLIKSKTKIEHAEIINHNVTNMG